MKKAISLILTGLIILVTSFAYAGHIPAAYSSKSQNKSFVIKKDFNPVIKVKKETKITKLFKKVMQKTALYSSKILMLGLILILLGIIFIPAVNPVLGGMLLGIGLLLVIMTLL